MALSTQSRDYLLSLIIEQQAALGPSSEQSELGYFADGIGLRWVWHVSKLVTLSDETLQALRDRWSAKGLMNLKGIEITYLPSKD